MSPKQKQSVQKKIGKFKLARMADRNGTGRERETPRQAHIVSDGASDLDVVISARADLRDAGVDQQLPSVVLPNTSRLNVLESYLRTRSLPFSM